MLDEIKNLVPLPSRGEAWNRTKSFIGTHKKLFISAVLIPCAAVAVSALVQKFFSSAPTVYSSDGKWAQPSGDPSRGASEFAKAGQDFLNARHKIFSFCPDAEFSEIEGLDACLAEPDFKTFAACAEKSGIPPWQMNVPLLKKKFGDVALTLEEGKKLYLEIEKDFPAVYKRGKDCLDQTLIRTTLCNSARAYICGRISPMEQPSICNPLQDGGDPVSLIGRYRSGDSKYGFIRNFDSARMCQGISPDGGQDQICHQNRDLGAANWRNLRIDLAVLSPNEVYKGFPIGQSYPDKNLPLISFTEPGKAYPEFEIEAHRFG